MRSQVAHAYENKVAYAKLLVRTLRKPIERMMQLEHEEIGHALNKMRTLTNNYMIPEKCCISHTVVFSKLKELDNDLVQHMHLENNILFPKTLMMENEMLTSE